MSTLFASLPLLGAAEWLGGAFSGLESGQRFALILIGIGCATAFAIASVVIISGTVESMHRNRVENDLKREMLDRGMAADEIAKVVESTTPKDFLDRWASSQGQKKSA